MWHNTTTTTTTALSPLYAVTIIFQEVERRLSKGEKDHFVPVHAGKEALSTVSLDKSKAYPVARPI